MIRLLALAAAVSLAAAACASGPSPTPPDPAAEPVQAVAQQGLIDLRVASPRGTWHTQEAIVIETSLTYLGPEPVVASGSGSGLVFFTLEQVGGRLRMDAAWTDDCARHELRPGMQRIPFQKSGGFSNDDPDAAFYRAFFADRQLHLPPGRWRISAVAHLTIGANCVGQAADPTATIEIVVMP